MSARSSFQRGPGHVVVRSREVRFSTSNEWGPDVIRVSALYPVTEGATFDHEYYRTSHVPMCCERWGIASAQVDVGINGPYTAAAHFLFDTVDAMKAALASDAMKEIAADVVNYTTISAVIQISNVATVS